MRPLRHSFQRLLRSPASGFRNTTTGDLSNVGTGGWAWSSSAYSASDTGASRLYFNSTNINVQGNLDRAHAFPVRCVQHLQAAFLPATKNAPS